MNIVFDVVLSDKYLEATTPELEILLEKIEEYIISSLSHLSAEIELQEKKGRYCIYISLKSTPRTL